MALPEKVGVDLDNIHHSPENILSTEDEWEQAVPHRCSPQGVWVSLRIQALDDFLALVENRPPLLQKLLNSLGLEM